MTRSEYQGGSSSCASVDVCAVYRCFCYRWTSWNLWCSPSLNWSHNPLGLKNTHHQCRVWSITSHCVGAWPSPCQGGSERWYHVAVQSASWVQLAKSQKHKKKQCDWLKPHNDALHLQKQSDLICTMLERIIQFIRKLIRCMKPFSPNIEIPTRNPILMDTEKKSI